MDQPFEENRYVQALLACQLEDDLKQLPKGDLTLIGERGTTLSGGQKARVAMARATYQNNEIFLLDDPISALDANVRKKVFAQLFTNVLKEKTRILVTHAVEWMHLADKVILMEKGQVKAFGTPEELADNEYVKKIQEIHKKHKTETEEVANSEKPAPKKAKKDKTEKKEKKEKKEDQSEESHSSYQSESSNEVETKEVADLANLTEAEVENKLEVFRGKRGKKEVDAIAKLMDRDDDEIVVDSDTYERVFQLTGGYKMIMFAIASQCATQAVGKWMDYIQIEWSFEDQEEQYGNLGAFLKTTFFAVLLSQVFQYCRDKVY